MADLTKYMSKTFTFHRVKIEEIENGLRITETFDSDIVESFISFNASPFLRSTNETGAETYQVLDVIGEIYNIPALATDFILIDLKGTVFIPGNATELIEYSVKLKPFRSFYEQDMVLSIGEVTATENVTTIGLSGTGKNSVRINGSIYDTYIATDAPYTPVTTGQKILIWHALPDSQVFHLAQGVESTEAVEPDYDGLFIARIIVDSGGQIVEESEVGYKPLAEDPWRNIIISNNTAVNVVMASSPSCSFNVLVGVGSTAPKIAGIRTKFTKNTRDGQEITFYNDSDTPVALLPGDYEETLVYTTFPFEEEYELKPHSFAKFKRKNNKYKLLPAGGAELPPGTNGQIYEIDNNLPEKIKPSDRLTSVENNKQDKSMFSALVDKWIHYWDSTTQKMQPILKLVSGAVNQLEFSGRIKADALVLPNNTNPVVANRLRSDGEDLFFSNASAVERRLGSGYSSARILGSTSSYITGTLTLNRKSQLVVTSTITSNSVFTIALSSPVENEINEYIFIFKTSSTNPVITYPSGIKWRGKSPILAINTTWTMVFENVYNGTTWEVYGLAIQNEV